MAGSSRKMKVLHSEGNVGQFDVKFLLPLGVPASRGILKIQGGPPRQTSEEYKGPLWHWKDGEWVKEEMG
jgi:hypothetical protein